MARWSASAAVRTQRGAANGRQTSVYGAFAADGVVTAACGAATTLGGLAGTNLSGAALAATGAALPDAAGRASFLSAHTMRPKRDARWKLPWPKIGDQDTPPLFFIA
jgi:hypothetical protein